MRLVEYADREMMMIDLANQLAGEINGHVLGSGAATLAVPGGTTPGPVFDNLCAADLHWAQVSVMLTDERWVPATSDRSNTRLLRERLLVGRAAEATLVPLHADAPTPEDALADLTAAVAAVLPISVLVLGMGDDMHTASLFPSAEELSAALDPHAPPILPVRPSDQPEARVTLTAPVLKAAISTHILITGAAKRAALDKARSLGDPVRAPILTVLGDATVHWAE